MSIHRSVEFHPLIGSVEQKNVEIIHGGAVLACLLWSDAAIAQPKNCHGRDGHTRHDRWFQTV